MPAGIVLAGGRSRRMGTPKAWLDWHGEPLLRRVVGLVARGAGGPVIVVRAPGQELPELPAGVRVVEDAREGQGPLQGLLAGLEAADGEVAFAASTDVPFLHPRFVAAVCRAVDGADAAVPFVDGFPQPLAAAYRTALVPLVAELVEAGRMKTGFLFERCETRWLEELPHPESVRNVNAPEDYRAALAEPEPAVQRALLRPAAAPGVRRPRGHAGRGRVGGRRAARRPRRGGAQRRPDRTRSARAAGRGRRGRVHGRGRRRVRSRVSATQGV